MNILKLIQLAKEYYAIEGNGVGGNLHIILDDGNIENNHIEYCLELSRQKNDLKGIELCELLLKISKTQRNKLIHNYSLYVG
jgi:hypothetical protein